MNSNPCPRGAVQHPGEQEPPRPSNLVETLSTFITLVGVGRSCDLGRPLFMGQLKGTAEIMN